MTVDAARAEAAHAALRASEALESAQRAIEDQEEVRKALQSARMENAALEAQLRKADEAGVAREAKLASLESDRQAALQAASAAVRDAAIASARCEALSASYARRGRATRRRLRVKLQAAAAGRRSAERRCVVAEAATAELGNKLATAQRALQVERDERVRAIEMVPRANAATMTDGVAASSVLSIGVGTERAPAGVAAGVNTDPPAAVVAFGVGTEDLEAEEAAARSPRRVTMGVATETATTAVVAVNTEAPPRLKAASTVTQAVSVRSTGADAVTVPVACACVQTAPLPALAFAPALAPALAPVPRPVPPAAKAAASAAGSIDQEVAACFDALPSVADAAVNTLPTPTTADAAAAAAPTTADAYTADDAPAVSLVHVGVCTESAAAASVGVGTEPAAATRCAAVGTAMSVRSAGTATAEPAVAHRRPVPVHAGVQHV